MVLQTAQADSPSIPERFRSFRTTSFSAVFAAHPVRQPERCEDLPDGHLVEIQ
jgi:hypothetical protein